MQPGVKQSLNFRQQLRQSELVNQHQHLNEANLFQSSNVIIYKGGRMDGSSTVVGTQPANESILQYQVGHQSQQYLASNEGDLTQSSSVFPRKKVPY